MSVVIARLTGFIIFPLLVLVLSAPALWAETYTYVDAEGVLHFSDRPGQSGRYVSLDRHQAGTAESCNKRYDHLIRRAAGKYRVAFALIKAMIKVESDFNPKAVSTAGAKGLMQIMPQNYPLLGITNPFHPGQNIMGGTRYFRQLLDHFNGHLHFALAAYNAGPQVVEQFGRIPPYPETINYVRQVTAYYLGYR